MPILIIFSEEYKSQHHTLEHSQHMLFR